MSGCCSACGEECGDLISLGFTQVCRYCFRETCLEEPLLEDFGPDFLERQGADFFLSWWWGCLPDRGRKVGSSKKHICKKGEAFSRGGANRKAGIHTGSISGMGGLSAWTVTEGKR